MFYYTYILLGTENGRHYVGCTHDLKARFVKHNTGKSKSTKHQPWKLIYYEACLSEIDARRRERYFKSTAGRRSLRLHLRDYYKSIN